MPAEYSFRDAQLRSAPVRALNRIGSWLEHAGWEGPTLDPDRVVAAAQKLAGATDLGCDSYREPLERYLRAAREEAQLNTFGRLAVQRMLARSLANRIELHGWTKQHPEIRQEQIAEPWVIVGLPRTGTSLLSILLGLDPLARPPLHWEAARPVPPPTLAGAASDPRIAENQKETDQLLKLNPAFGAMHPMGATLAQECVAFFLYDVRTLGVETQAFVPSYGRWLESCDMRPAYDQHHSALQALQSAQPTERWVLKTPNHLWCLETLLEVYPDARIIWTHRDPGPVVTSLASLVNTLQGMFTHREDPKPVAEHWKGKALHAIRRGMLYDDAAAAGWCCHLRYGDLVADPVGSVRKLYAHFDDEVSDLHARRMQAWMNERHQTAFGRHVYDPQDFGWSYTGLAEEFSDYRRRYEIPGE
jgi:hypothetical protein